MEALLFGNFVLTHLLSYDSVTPSCSPQSRLKDQRFLAASAAIKSFCSGKGCALADGQHHRLATALHPSTAAPMDALASLNSL